MASLRRKKRVEYWVLNGMRISYSLDDVMFEDFIDQKGHPYAIYDMNGNVLETNVEVNAFRIDYDKHIDFIKYMISQYGLE